MFSEREKKIIKTLGRRKMTLEKITIGVFKNDWIPFDATISIGNSVRRIIKKCSHHNLKWTLTKTRLDGKLTIKRTTL